MEDLVEGVAPLLHAHEPQVEVDGRVADGVEVLRALDAYLDVGAGGPGGDPRSSSACPRARSLPGGPSTSTTTVPVLWVRSEVREARSSRPLSSTTMLSAVRSSSPSRWLVTTTEMPKSAWTRAIRSSMSSRARGSSPLVGSSRKTSAGSWTRAWASLARCFMPVE
ncbi:hypothetical protein ON003_12495 [Janibacter hoylei]|nr:hypothetical protein [Janibacter hoylei]MCW4602336.1 hypothetical protein [Janibacter hoylei]